MCINTCLCVLINQYSIGLFVSQFTLEKKQLPEDGFFVQTPECQFQYKNFSTFSQKKSVQCTFWLKVFAHISPRETKTAMLWQLTRTNSREWKSLPGKNHPAYFSLVSNGTKRENNYFLPPTQYNTSLQFLLSHYFLLSKGLFSRKSDFALSQLVYL